MKRLLICVAALATAFAGSAMAQSAKFAAVYEDRDSYIIVKSDACASTEEAYCNDLGIDVAGDSDEVVWGAATIRVPQNKELLVGLSAQVALYTFTEAKGKKGTRSTAVATAEGGVTMYACPDPYIDGMSDCIEGVPGYITLSGREQELSAVLGGVLIDCNFDVDLGEDGAGNITFTAENCDFEQEVISLGLTTMAAHHFNFLFPDMEQGDYTIVAKFGTSAAASAEVACEYETTDCAVEDGDASAVAGAAIGKTMLTVQTVRAVNGSLNRGEIIEVLD